jgi:hypothetical protein
MCLKHFLFRITAAAFLLLIFLTFFNGLADKGPSRKKFRVLGSGSEDLTKPEAPPEVDKLQQIVNDRRLVDWATWWKKCVPDLDLKNMEDIGEFPLLNEPMEFQAADEVKKGPGKILYIKSPDGKRFINPYWGRLVYKKEETGWQPYEYKETRCGAELLNPSQKQDTNILECFMHDGLDGAFWLDKNRLVLLGYDAVTRQMSVECETVESCIAPSVWIVDLKANTYNQYRGAVMKRSACNLGGYLKTSIPNFFGK